MFFSRKIVPHTPKNKTAPNAFLSFITIATCSCAFLGRSLMIGWKKKKLKPRKGAHSSHTVYVCVRKQATGRTFWHGNLIFGLTDPWDMWKKRNVLFFEIFIFTLFVGIFSILSYYNTSTFFCFKLLVTARNVIFGLREPWTITNLRLFIFFIFLLKIPFLRLNGSFFRYFFMLQFSYITLVILEISIACYLSF